MKFSHKKSKSQENITAGSRPAKQRDLLINIIKMLIIQFIIYIHIDFRNFT